MDAVLLDTHAFLWWCEDSPELSKKARKTIAERACLLSDASIWEMAIKVSLGKLKMPAAFERYITEQMYANGFSEMEIRFRHIAACAKLPWHHRDPFDRMLIAQAIGEDVAIVSRDAVFAEYGVQRIW
jgi:PIN domain nuclease of toxin-antitoxin system